jgi:uncharacterized protein (DUF1684 family)
MRNAWLPAGISWLPASAFARSFGGPPKPWRRRLAGWVPVRALLSLMLATTIACSNKPPDDTKGYVETMAAARAAKDAELKTASDSPIPAERQAELLPLAYFPIAPEYRVPAVLKATDDSTVFEMVTSTGGKERMRRAGMLEFTLKAQPLKLIAFVPTNSSDRLFVPFTDLTTGTETYPGGRYIDLDKSPTGIYLIDFNRAYHPYCYYNTTWECPYPPAANRLKVPVRAGERLKHPNT